MNKYRNITTNIIKNIRHITADKQVSIIIVHILKDRQTDSAALVLKHTHTHTHTHTHERKLHERKLQNVCCFM